MRILVTGAAGHVGSSVVSNLKHKGFQIVGVDNFSSYYSTKYKMARVQAFGIKDDIKELDIRDKDSLNDLFDNFKPQKVVHLAARPGVRAQWRDISEYNSNNILGFENILTACHAHKVEQLIFASSSSVYGDLAQSPFKEESVLSVPKSYYALSKLTNEFHARNYVSSNDSDGGNHRMRLTGLRFFTIYGPWGRPDMATLRFITSGILKLPAELTAELSVARDFTYIDDVANFVNSVITNNQDSIFEIYNVCGGKPETLNNLISEINLNGIELLLNSRPQSEYDVKMTHGSTSKILAAGHPIPQTSLSTGVKNVVEWARSLDSKDLKKWIF